MYLVHHGVLGMHWGIRRYQNKDGSLTEEGIRRYSTNKRFRKKIDRKNSEVKEGVKRLLYNEDGTLTDFGVDLYLTNKQFRRSVDKTRQKTEKRRQVYTVESLKNLTDAEVASLAKRLKDEISVQDSLTKLIRTVPPSTSDKVKKYVATELSKAGLKLVGEITNTMTQKAIKTIVKGMFNDNNNNNNNNSHHHNP